MKGEFWILCHCHDVLDLDDEPIVGLDSRHNAYLLCYSTTGQRLALLQEMFGPEQGGSDFKTFRFKFQINFIIYNNFRIQVLYSCERVDFRSKSHKESFFDVSSGFA